ncbi:hypothetical protein AHAS_Ahas18G0003400 [Arachis hypogaea]
MVVKEGSRPPWVGLGAAVWVQIAAGNGYNFPLYSSALKSVLSLNQQQLTILGVANDVGENVGILPGIACNFLPPWSLLLIGALLCFLGYGALFLALTRTLSTFPYVPLCLALCVATNSNAWFGTAVLVTNMRNFPLSRGTISGILKGYVGISAAVYTLIYTLLLKHSASNLVLFLALGVPIACLIIMYFIRPCTPPSGEDSSVHVHFLFVQAASVLLATYLVTTTILCDIFSITGALSYVLAAIMLLLLMTPLVIPLKMTLFPSHPLHLVTSNQTDPLLAPSSSAASLVDEDASDIETLLAEGEGAVTGNKRRPKRGEDFKFREAIVKADFWLLWFVYFFGVGSGVTVLNNLAQIGVALGANDTTILLSLFSFCNFLGRLALDGTLYAATALLGVCYGVQYSIMVPTVSELFGLKNFGITSNFMMLGNPIGAIIFSALLAGTVYDAEAAKQGSSTCYGANCFRLTFLILAGVVGLGTILSIILTLRIRPVYKMLYAEGSFRLSHTSSH